MAALIGDFDEHYSSEVPVSGNIIAGVMLVSTAKATARGFSPHILVPGQIADDEIVCLSVVSQDGVYSSRNSYRVPAATESSLIPADYTKSLYKELLDDQAEAFAVKAMLGACGQNGNAPYRVASAGPQASDYDSLLLLIDSLGATDVIAAARTPDRKIIKGQCEEIIGQRKTGYDFTCRLPGAALAEGSLTVKVQRLRFGRKMPAVTIRVDS